MSNHHCNEECERKYNYGWNCAARNTNWNKANPPWQENGFWGGGIEPNEDDLKEIACHSSKYRQGYNDYNEQQAKK